jgi:hypothetical protein
VFGLGCLIALGTPNLIPVNHATSMSKSWPVVWEVKLWSSVFSSGSQATLVASGSWPRWFIFGGNSAHLPQK